MPLAPRPPPLFFAAFHRWIRTTQRPLPCSRTNSLHRCESPSSLNNHAPRDFRTSPACRQQAELKTIGQSVGHVGQEKEGKEEAGNTGDIDAASLREAARLLMRRVPSPVVVITTASPPSTPEDPLLAPLGMVVSSFNTVTLNPPTISFNIREPSKTLDAIRAAKGHLRVHILEASREGSLVAHLFTQGNGPEALSKRQEQLIFDVPDESHLAPRLRNAGVLNAFDCQLSQELSVSDHIIAVARIKHIEESNNETPRALSYVNGSYLGCDNLVIHRNET